LAGPRRNYGAHLDLRTGASSVKSDIIGDEALAGGSAVIHLTINGRAVSVPAGTTIWDAAQQLGIDIPVICHSPRLAPVGVCRMCVVDVGGRVLAASCVRPCEEGMTVRTNSELVEKQRRMLTMLLLADHPVPCEKEKTTGDCELELLGRRYGLIQNCKLQI